MKTLEKTKTLDIIARGQDFVAINKPAGLLVHRSPIDKTATAFALQIVRDQIGQRVYPVHRLDRPTSGALLFALNSAAAKHLAAQFSAQQVEKQYLAVVRGHLQPADGIIDYPLYYQKDKIADRDRADPSEPQDAQTTYRTLAQSVCPWQSSVRYPQSRYSLLALTPHQGRKHQIRRHLKHIAHPILGDTTHGDLRQNQALCQQTGFSRLLLHAHRLTFIPPNSQHPLTITAPVDADWRAVCAALNIEKC